MSEADDQAVRALAKLMVRNDESMTELTMAKVRRVYKAAKEQLEAKQVEWHPPSSHPATCWVVGEYFDHASRDVRVTAFYCSARLQWFRGSSYLEGDPILLNEDPIRWRWMTLVRDTAPSATNSGHEGERQQDPGED